MSYLEMSKKTVYLSWGSWGPTIYRLLCGAGSVDFHWEGLYHWWGSVDCWWGSIDMLCSVGGQGSRLLSMLSLDSTRHSLQNMCKSRRYTQYHLSLTIKIMTFVIMNISILVFKSIISYLSKILICCILTHLIFLP